MPDGTGGHTISACMNESFAQPIVSLTHCIVQVWFMNVTLLRRLRLSASVATLCLAFASSAHAETVFTVQLGSFESEKEARDHWQKLEKRFPEVFEPLNYASAKVQLPPDDFVYFRTQAGPISTRAKADDICKSLVVKGFECYVAETAMFMADGEDIKEDTSAKEVAEASPPPPPPIPTPPVAKQEQVDIMEAEEAAGIYRNTEPQKTLPAPEKPAPIATAPQAKADTAPAAKAPAATTTPAVALPWVDMASASAPAAGSAPFERGQSRYAGSGATASAPVSAPPPALPPVAVSNGEMADLKVAEAVPVPLGEIPASTGGSFSMGAPSTARGLPSQNFRRPTLWAEVSYFTTQDAALGYWRTLRSRDNQIPQGLRLRVVKPLQQRGNTERLSLRIGPFDNVNVIRRLCSHTVPENLRCQAMRDIGSSVSYGQQRQRVNPADAYARRQGATSASPFTAPSYGNGSHWVQLGAFPTMAAAQMHWGSLKEEHGRVLDNAREQISAPALSSASRPLFRLRAGPFSSSMEALNTCDALKRSGAACLVVQGR